MLVFRLNTRFDLRTVLFEVTFFAWRRLALAAFHHITSGPTMGHPTDSQCHHRTWALVPVSTMEALSSLVSEHLVTFTTIFDFSWSMRLAVHPPLRRAEVNLARLS